MCYCNHSKSKLNTKTNSVLVAKTVFFNCWVTSSTPTNAIFYSIIKLNYLLASNRSNQTLGWVTGFYRILPVLTGSRRANYMANPKVCSNRSTHRFQVRLVRPAGSSRVLKLWFIATHIEKRHVCWVSFYYELITYLVFFFYQNKLISLTYSLYFRRYLKLYSLSFFSYIFPLIIFSKIYL